MQTSIDSTPSPSTTPQQLTNAGVRPIPRAPVDWLLPDDTERVLDLGAGTGKLTRQLVERYPAV